MSVLIQLLVFAAGDGCSSSNPMTQRKSSRFTSVLFPVCTLRTVPFLQSDLMQFAVIADSGSASWMIRSTSLMVLILCNAIILPSFQGRQLSHTNCEKSRRYRHCLQRVSKRDFTHQYQALSKWLQNLAPFLAPCLAPRRFFTRKKLKILEKIANFLQFMV